MKVKIFNVKLNIMMVIIVLMFIVLLMDASRLAVDMVEVGFFKYFLIGIFALMLVIINPKKTKGDFLSYLGLCVFLLFTSIFTIINHRDSYDLVVLLGYWAVIFIYAASISVDPLLEKSLTKAMTFIGMIVLAINLLYLSDPQAYSLEKNQFTGIFLNANFLAGISSCFLLFFAFKKKSGHRLLALTNYLAVGASVILLTVSFSRGAILSVIVVFLLYFAKKGFFRVAIFGAILLLVAYFFTTGAIDYSNISNRDLFEESGRLDIFNRYLDAFRETYLIIGTGISTDFGRIKSELSYFDIMLFSGVGFLGFFLFVGRSVYFALKQPVQMWSWVEVVFLNIVVMSLFEGYAANVASIPSILFYILPAIIISKIKMVKRAQVNNISL